MKNRLVSLQDKLLAHKRCLIETVNATRGVIAQRLSTICNVDLIHVVQAGRVMQAGTFNKLMQQEGLFATLTARQLD